MEEMMMKKRGEKSKFSITCSLLSQYLKEKGSLAAINGLEMAPAAAPLHLHPRKESSLKSTPTTLNLLPGVDASAEEISKSMAEADDDLVPPPNKEAAAEKPPPPLTIFYDGKVVVFNDIPADKVEGLMEMASKESAHQNHRFAAAVNSPPPSSAIDGNGLPKTVASGMPIPRRNSLHRFLEKRKNRITTNAPYYVPTEPPVLALAKATDHQGVPSWLGLGRPAREMTGN